MDYYQVPLGFGMALARNFNAMNAYSAMTEAEKREIGLPADADDEAREVYCRVGIPAGRPDLAGFDMGHLVFVSRKTGRAIEAERAAMPFVPLNGGKGL